MALDHYILGLKCFSCLPNGVVNQKIIKNHLDCNLPFPPPNHISPSLQGALWFVSLRPSYFLRQCRAIITGGTLPAWAVYIATPVLPVIHSGYIFMNIHETPFWGDCLFFFSLNNSNTYRSHRWCVLSRLVGWLHIHLPFWCSQKVPNIYLLILMHISRYGLAKVVDFAKVTSFGRKKIASLCSYPSPSCLFHWEWWKK